MHGANDTSFATQVSNLTALDPPPDFLFICAFPTGGTGAMREIRAAGHDQPILSSNTYDGDTWIPAIPDISNMFIANYGSMWGDDPNPAVNEFFARYIDQYGLPANSNVLTGYSVIQAFALAAEAAGTTDGDAVAKALEEIGTMDLLVGPTTFTADLHIDLLRPQQVTEIQNGTPAYRELWQLENPPKIEF